MAYQRDLYALRQANDDNYRQRYELEFFQLIDDRAATAIDAVSHDRPLTEVDRVAISQFATSLLYRRPQQLERLMNALRQRMGDDLTDPDNPQSQAMMRDTILEMLGTMIGETKVTKAIAQMKCHVVALGQTTLTFLTSDAPVMTSLALGAPDAFIAFPIDPKRLLVLSNSERTAEALGTYPPRLLAKSFSDAIVRQADHLVVSSSSSCQRFVDRLFQRSERTFERCNLHGLIAWEPPGNFDPRIGH